MIDIQVKSFGDAEIVDKLRKAPTFLRTALIDAMVEVGNEVVAGARARAPVRRGFLRDAVHFQIKNPAGNPLLYVTPYAQGALHAHLLERGVERQKIRVYRPVRASRLQEKFRRPNGQIVWRSKRPNRVRNRSTFLYTRMHQIKAHPYFIPAVAAAGNVPERMQAAVDKAAAEVGSA